MSKLFALNGIASPGRVNLMKYGTVNLEDLPDEIAIEVYKSGCPFLAPLPEAYPILYPDMEPIVVKELPAAPRTKAKTGSKKKSSK